MIGSRHAALSVLPTDALVLRQHLPIGGGSVPSLCLRLTVLDLATCLVLIVTVLVIEKRIEVVTGYDDIKRNT